MGRALLLLLAVAAVVVAVAHERDDRACRSAQRAAFAVGLDGRGRDAPAIARRVVDGCTGGAALAAASTGLLRGGAVDAAALLAREAVARDPDDHHVWSAFAAVLAERGNAAGAAAARARVAVLKPARPAPG